MEDAMSDVWCLEKQEQEDAIIDLTFIVEAAMKFRGVSERAYLRGLWDGERWKSIKDKLQTEGSAWYVWWMDGVNQHLRNVLGG